MATKKATKKSTAVAKRESSKAVENSTHSSNLPANIAMGDYAGAGLENTDRDSFAIPFLAIMQKGSPQVDKDDEAHVEGAEVGDLMLTSTQELFKDEDGVDVVFCGYRRVFLRWAPVDSGGGFKGELSVDEVQRLRSQGELVEEDGKLFANNGDLVRDTRIHYVLVVREDGTFTPAVISMSSTQIKKSKMLLTQIQSYIAKDSSGRSFNPPSFGHVFHAETIAESNDKGSWRGWKLTRTGFVEDPDLFRAAVEFHETVKGEGVRVNYEEAAQAAGVSSNGASTSDSDEI